MTNCACGLPLTNNWIHAETHDGRCCPECPNCASACQPRQRTTTPTFVQATLDRLANREEITHAKRRTRRHA